MSLIYFITEYIFAYNDSPRTNLLHFQQEALSRRNLLHWAAVQINGNGETTFHIKEAT